MSPEKKIDTLSTLAHSLPANNNYALLNQIFDIDPNYHDQIDIFRHKRNTDVLPDIETTAMYDNIHTFAQTAVVLEPTTGPLSIEDYSSGDFGSGTEEDLSPEDEISIEQDLSVEKTFTIIVVLAGLAAVIICFGCSFIMKQRRVRYTYDVGEND